MFDFPAFAKLFSLPDALSPSSNSFNTDLKTKNDEYARYTQDLCFLAKAHSQQAMETALNSVRENTDTVIKVATALNSPKLAEHCHDYWADAAQRAVLFADAMRQRGNYFIEHEEGATRRS